MAALTGRIHDKNTQFWLDDSAGTFTNLSAYIDSVGAVGLDKEVVDVTAFSDQIHNFLNGLPTAPITVTGPNDTNLINHLKALSDVTPLSLGIYYGVRAAWESGAPTFGISSSSTSGYIFGGFTVSGGKITAKFNVFGPTAPSWQTTAFT